jgi:hypothetical protein
VPRSVAMKLTGHKTESVYNRYAIVAEQDLREGSRAPHGRESHSAALREEDNHGTVGGWVRRAAAVRAAGNVMCHLLKPRVAREGIEPPTRGFSGRQQLIR